MIIERTGLFPPLASETRKSLDSISLLIDKALPMPARFRAALPRDIAALSRLLTAERPERDASYLSRPAFLSAYMRYFLPWNIYRLCRLFTSLPIELKPGDAVNDLGSGPLTLAIALWISRPHLRNIPLEFRCLDRTAAVLDAGKKLYAALAADSSPWTIKTIRGELRTGGSLTFGSLTSASRTRGALSVEINGKPAALTAAINVYNELFWNFSPTDIPGLKRFAINHARLLSSLTGSSGSVLVMEPGIPRSGQFISLLRSSLMEEGRFPVSPCPHSGPCPMPGTKSGGCKKDRWCHFAFDTKDAPKELHRLSAAARLPKERAVLSFLFAGAKSRQDSEATRVISDCFPLEGQTSKGQTFKSQAWGRYGCSRRGLVLVKGSRKSLEASPSGALEELPLTNGVTTADRWSDGSWDTKSGALIAEKP